MKRVRGDEVVETLDRDGLVVTQTPQAFLADVLRRAAAGRERTAQPSSRRKAAGSKPCRAIPRLLKVTSREDLELVASWL